jgi:hypothetical protein
MAELQLAADIRAVTDGGGESTASPYPIVGRRLSQDSL